VRAGAWRTTVWAPAEHTSVEQLGRRSGRGPSGLRRAASAVSATGATLSGTVDAQGSPTAFTFEHGLTNAFGSISAVDSAGSQQVSLTITGLTPGTQYRYRIVATNANGTTAGSVGSFTTAPAG
jgi:hypothetical protein